MPSPELNGHGPRPMPAAPPSADGDAHVGDDALSSLYRLQRQDDRRDGVIHPEMTARDRARVTRDLLLDLAREGWQVDQELSSESGVDLAAPADGALRSNIEAALARLGATWLSLLSVWDMAPPEVVREYRRQRRVRLAHRRMREQPWPADAPVVGFDMDGVLADYVGGLLCFLNERLGTSYTPSAITRSGVGRNLPLDRAAYRALKREFRDSGREGLHCAPIPGALRFLHDLRSKGYRICLLTGRPAARFKRLVPDTFEWLERHRVPYDACLFDARKADRLAELRMRSQVVAFFEDSAEEAVRIAELGIPVWIRRAPYNPGVAHPLVRYFETFESLDPLF
jgi:FMN phosphatase YigB (HAD superfamily)